MFNIFRKKQKKQINKTYQEWAKAQENPDKYKLVRKILKGCLINQDI